MAMDKSKACHGTGSLPTRARIPEQSVEHQHSQRVDRDHDQGQTVVSSGQIAQTRTIAVQGLCPAKCSRQVASPQRNLKHFDSLLHDDRAGTVSGTYRQFSPKGIFT